MSYKNIVLSDQLSKKIHKKLCGQKHKNSYAIQRKLTGSTDQSNKVKNQIKKKGQTNQVKQKIWFKKISNERLGSDS